MKRFLIAISIALALSACTTTGTLQDRAAVTSVNAMSLAELAFTSMEQAATAYINRTSTTPAQAQHVGELMLEARGYRDQARLGGNNSLALQNLNAAIANINAIVGAKK